MRKWVRLVAQVLPTVLHDRPTFHRYAKDPEKYPLQERYEFIRNLFVKANRKGFHDVFFIEGEENLPKGQVLFCGNHTSFADPIIQYQISERPISFVAKKESAKMIFVGDCGRAMGNEFLDRSDLRSEIKSFRNIDKKLTDHPELSFFVYPEGTRSMGPEFELLEFHPGAFKIATKRGLPIVPVAMWLSERTFNQQYHYKKYPVQVSYLKPLYPEDYQHMTNAEIATLVRSRIEEALKDMKVKDRELVKTLNHYSDKKTDKVLRCRKTKKKS